MTQEDERLLDYVRRAIDGPGEGLPSEQPPPLEAADQRQLGDLAGLQEIRKFHQLLQNGRDPRAEMIPAEGERSQNRSDPEEPRRWGKLEIIRELGEGAYARVYFAHDPNLDCDVALKLYKSQGKDPRKSARDHLREGRLMARVRHPHVAVVHGIDEIDGSLGLWMEYIKGQSLDTLLKSQGPFGAAEAAVIGIDLCRALAAVHAQGMVHQDVKAENVIREEGGRIVLMDFGVGREVGPEREGFGAGGTPTYMAPEALLNGKVSVASDIYSLGVLIFHLVTKAFPVEATDFEGLLQAHRAGSRVLLRDIRPDLPGGLIGAVEKAIAADPKDRFASMGEMERALTLAIGGRPGEKPRDEVRRFGLSAKSLIAIASAVAVVGIVSAYLLIQRSGRDALHKDSYTVGAHLVVYPRGIDTPRDLRDGDKVRIGDRLCMRFHTSKPTYVYVISYDQDGLSYALFPLPGFDLANPVPAGSELQLPGRFKDTSQGWEVNTRGREERILVISTPKRNLPVEEEMASMRIPGRGEVGDRVPLSRGAARALRGLGGLAEIPEESHATPSEMVYDIYRKASTLEAGDDTSSGTWMRRIHLLNP